MDGGYSCFQMQAPPLKLRVLIGKRRAKLGAQIGQAIAGRRRAGQPCVVLGAGFEFVGQNGWVLTARLVLPR
jgi:hypothetical protein